MKTKHILILMAVILVVSGVIYSNTNSPALNTPATPVGVIGPLSGFLASYGEEMQAGVASASSSVKTVAEDDGCDPKLAVSAFEKLINIDKVKIVIGPGCGSPQEAIVPIVKDKDVIVLLPSASSEELFARSNGKVYNLQGSLQKEAVFLAESIYNAGHKNVAVVGYNNAFSKVHLDTFRSTFKGTITHESVFNDEKSDVKTELLKIKQSNPDAIFVSDVSFFFGQGMKYMKEIGLNVPIYSQYAVEIASVTPLAEGVIYSYPTDIIQGRSAVYSLSKESLLLAEKLERECGASTSCMKDSLDKSEQFDKNGIVKRGFILKQVKEGVPTAL